MSDFPDFRSPAFLRQHIRDTMAFYHPHCLDPTGGCFHYYKDNGDIYDRVDRHLVSSARFVFDYAMYARHFGGAEYLDGARHCVAFIRDVHRNPST
ncbi:MAG: AGE family epimerase/isomerase, partial [Xanthomonadaceae bacterium]|nr:AGE family epimerase/isomerase [Xanthomonadaceae bacterium]